MGADMITIVLCFDSITNDTRSGDSTEDELIAMLVEDKFITEDDAMCLSALENFSGLKTQRDGFESCPEILDAAEEVFEARGGVDNPDSINTNEVLEIVERAGKLSSDDVRCPIHSLEAEKTILSARILGSPKMIQVILDSVGKPTLASLLPREASLRLSSKVSSQPGAGSRAIERFCSVGGVQAVNESNLEAPPRRGLSDQFRCGCRSFA